MGVEGLKPLSNCFCTKPSCNRPRSNLPMILQPRPTNKSRRSFSSCNVGRLCTNTYVCIYIYVYIYIFDFVYVYIYIERERDSYNTCLYIYTYIYIYIETQALAYITLKVYIVRPCRNGCPTSCAPPQN